MAKYLQIIQQPGHTVSALSCANLYMPICTCQFVLLAYRGKKPQKVLIQAPPASTKSKADIEIKFRRNDIVNSIGLVECILDSNFALIYGPAFTTSNDK